MPTSVSTFPDHLTVQVLLSWTMGGGGGGGGGEEWIFQ